eukprot:Nk52_evm24s1705 gene=Nk52_evmTU24s1705
MPTCTQYTLAARRGKGKQSAVDLEAYRVGCGGIGTVYYVPDFITREEEEELMKHVYGVKVNGNKGGENRPSQVVWKDLRNRRLQYLGGLPSENGIYEKRLPTYLSPYISRLEGLEVFREHGVCPNHVLVNEYLPGQGIMPHVDGNLYTPVIATISLGSHTVLDFYKERHLAESEGIYSMALDARRSISLYVQPRSLLVLAEDIYFDYLHGIEEVKNDAESLSRGNVANLDRVTGDGSIPTQRSTRVSLTFRHSPKMLNTVK